MYDRLTSVLEKLVPKSTLQVPEKEHVPSSIILQNGDLFTNIPVTYTFMEPQACHDNVLYLYKRHKIKHMCIGYALAADFKWRYHSWGLSHADSIVETTAPFLKYYGCIMVE